MKHQVCVVSGTRADYGLLRPLLIRLRDCPEIELTIAATGSHLSAAFGGTVDELTRDGFAYDSVPFPLDDDSKAGMARATGAALSAFADYFSARRPDLLVVLGDRYEIFAAAIAAHFSGIPIAHISGGDVTEGAVDDAIRHSVTKMSTLHFPGCEQSRRRIIQMGESPERVFNVGEPGVENCLNTPLLSVEELAESLQFDLTAGPYSVVTFHPVTLEDNTAERQLHELIAAMDVFPAMSYIVTLANADAGGRAINAIWQAEGVSRKNWLVVPSLGMRRYLSALKGAEMALGNSSSGIVEAPAMHIPTVNIGDRQKGRMRAESVIDCPPEREAVTAAMKKAMTPEFKAVAANTDSPFGDGRTSKKILSELLRFLRSAPHNTKKTFYDLPVME